MTGTEHALKNDPRYQRPRDSITWALPGLTCDVGDVARHRCESARVAVGARSSPVQHPDHGASFEFSLSWLPPL